MASEFEPFQSRMCKRPLLIILVGESGSGKSTFAAATGLRDKWIVSSDAIIRELKARGLSHNHVNIHSLANEFYSKDPYWQVPQIVSELHKKRIIIYDGPRRLPEVERLLCESANNFMIEIVGNERYSRLRVRDDAHMTIEEYRQILRDECDETDLTKICKLADVTLFNTGDIGGIEGKAASLAQIIQNHRALGGVY